MQQYAEDAVTEHLKELQGYFFKEKKGAKKAPYTFRLTQEQVDEILGRAMRLSDRYRIMKKAGATEAEIKKAFDTPEEMSVFSWEGGERHHYDPDGFHPLLQVLPSCRFHVHGPAQRTCQGIRRRTRTTITSSTIWPWWDAAR